MKFEVVFDVVTEPRDTNWGAYSTRSDLADRTVVVEAGSSHQAERLVEAMFGGSSNIRIKVAKILY